MSSSYIFQNDTGPDLSLNVSDKISVTFPEDERENQKERN